MLDLNIPIEKLKFVGPKNKKLLKNLNITNIRELLWHLPFKYDDFSKITPIALLNKNEEASIIGEITDITTTRSWKRKMSITTAMIADNSEAIRAVWFNQPYIEKSLPIKTKVGLAGTVKLDKEGLFFSSPIYENVSSYEFQVSGPTHTGRLVPKYPQTIGVTSKYLRFLIKPLLKKVDDIPESIPANILKKYNLPPIGQALKDIHFPDDLESAQRAKNRLAFNELFLFQLKALQSRRAMAQLKAPVIKFKSDITKSAVDSLPFKLTSDQKISTYEILKDLERTYPMNRLLNGDVGSGKTVVALIAAHQAINEGYQVAFMAPTEILAQQHYQTIKVLIGNLGMKVNLLTASTKNKKKIVSEINSGQPQLVVGTHALIQKGVSFSNLGLVIVDEQHRFGIEQRAKLLRRDPNTTNSSELPENNNKIIEKDLSYKLNGIFFNIHKKLGRFCREKQYGDMLEIKLKEQKIDFQREYPIEVANIKSNFADFIIEGRIIIEMKAKPFIKKEDYYQTKRYLELANKELGLIVNFQQVHLKPKRVLNSKFGAFGSNSQYSDQVPHLLSMTATPIPRTLALTIYGDLDVSLIKEKPKGRRKIITKVIAPSKRDEAYQFIDQQLSKGQQAFIVCPRIEASEATDIVHTRSAQNKMNIMWQEVKAVEEEYEKISKDILPHRRVAMLHGKMKPKEKQEIMEKFKEGDYDVLVSTSVIEVGVDIPNATIMAIENAERFGLAQLHQFRGRVGRGEHQSYCLLISGTRQQAENKRLKALVASNDGFELAEEDLKIRGPGQFFGTQQSGMPDLAMASLSDLSLIKKARHEAKLLLNKDPNLSGYENLRKQLSNFQRIRHFE